MLEDGLPLQWHILWPSADSSGAQSDHKLYDSVTTLQPDCGLYLSTGVFRRAPMWQYFDKLICDKFLWFIWFKVNKNKI